MDEKQPRIIDAEFVDVTPRPWWMRYKLTLSPNVWLLIALALAVGATAFQGR
jgi:hypothetical protein